MFLKLELVLASYSSRTGLTPSKRYQAQDCRSITIMYRDDLACEHIIDRMRRGQYAIEEKDAIIRTHSV